MQTDVEATATQPETREYKMGFMSRRRRLRNRWNIHMRKDERARERTERRNEHVPFPPVLES